MSKRLTISCEDIIHNMKLSYQFPSVVEAIATSKIISDAAVEAGIQVQPEELQQAGDRVRFANKLVKATDTWAWLKKHHLSLDEFEQLIRINVLSSKLAHHLFSKQVETFFFAHQLNYMAAVTYEVVLDDRDLALELFYALQENEISFPEVARQYIQDPQLRRAWGYQGIRYRQDFRPEIATAVFATTTPAQIIKPIVSSKGVHLIWVEEIIHPKLDEALRMNIQQDLFSSWLKQQIEQADVDIQLASNNDLQPSKELLPSA
ncbi:MAG: peptidylprolyl isomerase [Rhizonema sp. PD38]|nr:peptidylprolyl isomerase [Rhizonema sp. PD38]